MMDLKLNREMDITFDDGNDLDTVIGREQFNQQVAIYLQVYLYDKIGRYGNEELFGLIKMEIKSVARDYSKLDDVRAIDIQRHDEIPNSVEITILYQSGEEFDMVIS